MKCPHCGKDIPNDCKHCPECGGELTAKTPDPQADPKPYKGFSEHEASTILRSKTRRDKTQPKDEETYNYAGELRQTAKWVSTDDDYTPPAPAKEEVPLYKKWWFLMIYFVVCIGAVALVFGYAIKRNHDKLLEQASLAQTTTAPATTAPTAAPTTAVKKTTAPATTAKPVTTTQAPTTSADPEPANTSAETAPAGETPQEQAAAAQTVPVTTEAAIPVTQ